MRESWTDERLDDFRAETHLRFDRIESRIDALQRTIIFSNAAIFVAVLGVFATQL